MRCQDLERSPELRIVRSETGDQIVLAPPLVVNAAEVDHIVEPGQLDPQQIHIPSVFVDRVVAVGGGPAA